jgi:hypothetical protein
MKFIDRLVDCFYYLFKADGSGKVGRRFKSNMGKEPYRFQSFDYTYDNLITKNNEIIHCRITGLWYRLIFEKETGVAEQENYSECLNLSCKNLAKQYNTNDLNTGNFKYYVEYEFKNVNFYIHRCFFRTDLNDLKTVIIYG